MAWCRVSSLTAAVSRALTGSPFPMTRSQILRAVAGRTLEGWELDYFLGKAMTERKYATIKAVLADLDAWLEEQG